MAKLKGQADVGEMTGDIVRGAADLREIEVLIGIEIEDHAVGLFDLLRALAQP
jgi:hypothetical protein